MIKAEGIDRRFNTTLQKKLAETKRLNGHQKPDLTDFMNDMFFGTTNVADDNKKYDLTGGDGYVLRNRNDDVDDFDSSTRSVSSRQTQEWLQEAKRIVASSPTRGNTSPSPSRSVGSPRFAASQARFSTSSLDKRDPLSGSARRHRALEGFSGEILSKTARHTRKGSDPNLDTPQSETKTAEVQKWISNNIKIPNNPDPTTISPDPTPPSPTNHLSAPPLPPRQSVHRRSRFQTDPNSPLSHPITIPTNPPAKRSFKTNGSVTTLDTHLLSPPKHLVESAHRRSKSSSTCSLGEAEVLSPPRNLVESAHRRSISSSTCRNDRIMEKDNNVNDERIKPRDLKVQGQGQGQGNDLNGFLKEQRVKIGKLMSGEIDGKAKIVLSGPSNSTSSMVAAVCYAWLLENRMKKGGSNNEDNLEFVVPVMNIRRGKMWRQRQVAWLFDHVGLDASSLLFSNEVAAENYRYFSKFFAACSSQVDLETLMMSKQLSLLVVGEDILRTNREVGSACTILTDNYCEDAYDLLQTPILKKLLLAGILLDTQNLSAPLKLSTTKDAEAVQLLSVASAPNYGNKLFDQLMQDQKNDNFSEVLCNTYGKPPSEIKWDNGAPAERKISEKNASGEVIKPSDDKKQNNINDARAKRVSPIPGKPTPSPKQTPAKTPVKAADASQGKKGNFFSKLFGFGR